MGEWFLVYFYLSKWKWVLKEVMHSWLKIVVVFRSTFKSKEVYEEPLAKSQISLCAVKFLARDVHQRLLYACSYYFIYFTLTDIIHREFQKMTLDVITSTAFGIETETVKNGDSVWLQKVKWIFNPNIVKKRPLHRKIIQFVLCK